MEKFSDRINQQIGPLTIFGGSKSSPCSKLIKELCWFSSKSTFFTLLAKKTVEKKLEQYEGFNKPDRVAQTKINLKICELIELSSVFGISIRKCGK